MNWFKRNKIEIILFFFLWLIYAYFVHSEPGWNINTRIDLIYALVDRGTLEIDAYYNQPSKEYLTSDIAVFQGHHYSDKAPGLALLGVPIYAGFINLATLVGWHPTPTLCRYIITIFTVGLLSAILGVFLYRFLAYFNENKVYRLLLVFAYMLGTIAFPYSTLFFSHIPAAAFSFLAFYLIFRKMRYQQSDARSQTVAVIHQRNLVSSFWLLTSGFLSGYALITEYPVGIIVIGLIVYLYFQRKKFSEVILFIIPILVCCSILFIINYLQYGTPFALGYQYEQIPMFRTGMSRGLMGITYPTIDAIYGTTVSPYRGLFFWSPVLILGLIGLFFMKKDTRFRKEFWLFLYIIIAFFIFNFSYYTWWGGWATGPRHIIPMLPFLSIPMLYCFSRWTKLSIGLTCISMVVLFIATAADPQVPEHILYPLWQFAIPKLLDGYPTLNLGNILFGLNRLPSLIPIIIILAVGIIILVKLSLMENNKS
ncbi:MAG: hypothetical protein ACE14V_05745 [bacterium]